MRKIYYITGTRADYGLMRKTLSLLSKQEEVKLSLIVTGMHLCEEFGLTINEIEKDGFSICKTIPYEMFPQTGSSMALGVSEIIRQCVQCFLKDRPDVLLVLGDRGEMLAATIAAVHMNIPVVHIHGGERTGTIDESIRHAISKMAHYHFVSTQQSKLRLEKMGEVPDNIFVVGAPGLDGIEAGANLTRLDIASILELDINEKWILFLMHPVVQDTHDRFLETKQILNTCLETKSQIIALMPNSDSGGDEIRKAIESFKNNQHIKILTHVQRNLFLSLLNNCDLLLGNSSSGIIEAASFGIPVINIGNRQNLRERNANVVDVKNNDSDLPQIIKNQLLHGKYKVKNVYKKPNACETIVQLLIKINLDKTILNKFNTY